jgi:O-antigen ligase
VLIQSIKVSLRNPVFGVGVGNFQVAAARSSKEDNLRALWLETHNSYTQISSEAGLPALAVFVMLIWYSLRQPFRMYKAASRFPQLYATAQVGFWLSMTVLNYAVTILFTSVAYSIFLPTLAGLASAYSDAARREIAQAEAEASTKPAAPPSKQQGPRTAGTPRPAVGYRGQISR